MSAKLLIRLLLNVKLCTRTPSLLVVPSLFVAFFVLVFHTATMTVENRFVLTVPRLSNAQLVDWIN